MNRLSTSNVSIKRISHVRIPSDFLDSLCFKSYSELAAYSFQQVVVAVDRCIPMANRLSLRRQLVGYVSSHAASFSNAAIVTLNVSILSEK